MKSLLLNIGFNNSLVLDRIIAILTPESAPVKRLKEDARKAGMLIDATQGRRTRSLVITDSNHVVLSAIQPETLAQRIEFDAEKHAVHASGGKGKG